MSLGQKTLEGSPRPPSDNTITPSPPHPNGDATAVDLTALGDKEPKDMPDHQEIREKQGQEKGMGDDKPVLSQRMKWTLLFMFSLAYFVDVLSYSAFFVLTRGITADLDISFEMQSWVITSYAVTFASFLLFWGRVSDLYSATYVFSYGFVAFGVLNLVISFLPEKFSFLVVRAISGIAGAALIPASYRLIAHVFAPHELGKAYTLYGMTGGFSNVLGVILAGFIEYIPNGGQMAAWRWFFRIVAIIVLPFSVASLRLVPMHRGAERDAASRWKRLDLPGAIIALGAIILVTLGLTLGASHGWRTPAFLVPFLLSFVLFPAFFLWEAYLGPERAMLPPNTWRLPNFTLFIVFSLQIYPWWAINFLGLIETWMGVYGERAILAAVRTLPEGLICLAVSFLLTLVPVLVARPRWTVAAGQFLGVLGYILLSRTTHPVGSDYWRFIFPGMLLGSGGNMAAFIGTNVAIMTSVPPEVSGVAGAVLQVGLQLGATVGFAVQAGLLTVHEGGLSNPENLRASFYFQLGWAALWLIGFLVFFRPPKAPASGASAAEQARPGAQ